jgi:hypothetical protein
MKYTLRHFDLDEEGYELTIDQLEARSGYEDPYKGRPIDDKLMVFCSGDRGILRIRERHGIVVPLFQLLSKHPLIYHLIAYRGGLIEREYDAKTKTTTIYNRKEHRVRIIKHDEQMVYNLAWAPPLQRERQSDEKSPVAFIAQAQATIEQYMSAPAKQRDLGALQAAVQGLLNQALTVSEQQAAMPNNHLPSDDQDHLQEKETGNSD